MDLDAYAGQGGVGGVGDGADKGVGGRVIAHDKASAGADHVECLVESEGVAAFFAAGCAAFAAFTTTLTAAAVFAAAFSCAFDAAAVFTPAFGDVACALAGVAVPYLVTASGYHHADGQNDYGQRVGQLPLHFAVVHFFTSFLYGFLRACPSYALHDRGELSRNYVRMKQIRKLDRSFPGCGFQQPAMGSQWRGAGRGSTGWGDSRRYGEDRGERRRTGGRLRALYERMSESGVAGFIGFSGWRGSCWGCWVDRGVGREFMRVYERRREIGGKIGVGAGLSGLVRVGWCVFGVKVDGWGRSGGDFGG